ncbi:MAG: hypothetical protein M3081_19055 [Gemmatimonadota bacterium]|nr:hypothetical protein [Gemmatimonadota bacterium]
MRISRFFLRGAPAVLALATSLDAQSRVPSDGSGELEVSHVTGRVHVGSKGRGGFRSMMSVATSPSTANRAATSATRTSRDASRFPSGGAVATLAMAEPRYSYRSA